MSRDRDIEASKSLLGSERQASGSTVREELIKCFCGTCGNWFKRKTIEYAIVANGLGILQDNDSRDMLKKFLIFRQGRSRFLNQTMVIVNCYELCEDVVNGVKDLEENRADINDMCNDYWNDKLVNAINDGTTNDFFYALMHDFAIQLENFHDYQLFKEELKKKLRR